MLARVSEARYRRLLHSCSWMARPPSPDVGRVPSSEVVRLPQPHGARSAGGHGHPRYPRAAAAPTRPPRQRPRRGSSPVPGLTAIRSGPFLSPYLDNLFIAQRRRGRVDPSQLTQGGEGSVPFHHRPSRRDGSLCRWGLCRHPDIAWQRSQPNAIIARGKSRDPDSGLNSTKICEPRSPSESHIVDQWDSCAEHSQIAYARQGAAPILATDMSITRHLEQYHWT